MGHPVAAPAIFLFTIYLVLARPRNLDTGVAALAGAVLALLAGVITLADVRTVAGIVWDATFALIAIVVISVILDQAGLFRWAALQMARRAGGDGRRIFLAVILLGAVVSTLFTNDATVLILTPIVYEMLAALGFDERLILPYMMACGFVADSMSIPLAVSNLTNMITARYFSLGFAHFALLMLLPAILCLLATVAVLYGYYRRSLPARYDMTVVPEPAEAIRDPFLFRIGLGVLGVMVLAFFVNSMLIRIPVSFVIAGGATVLLLATLKNRTVRPFTVVQRAPWSVIVFAVGMNLVVYGLGRSGFTALLVKGLEAVAAHGLMAATFAAGIATSLMSGLFNNLPAVMTGALAIQAATVSEHVRQAMVFANVVGSDVGAKLTPIGSLATLIWLGNTNKKGVRVTWIDYFRTVTFITVPVLLITLLGLWLSVGLLG